MPFTYEYPRPALTVDAIVFRKNREVKEVLLIQRKFYPFEGMWALPGGFIEMDETCEDAVVRELKEETNLVVPELHQMVTFSSVKRDPRGRTISVFYVGFAQLDDSEVVGGDDAGDAQWFDVNKLPDLAFDHIEAIEMANKRYV